MGHGRCGSLGRAYRNARTLAAIFPPNGDDVHDLWPEAEAEAAGEAEVG
jgi:hypothetical protein